jgi:hypothetical protein
LLLLEEFTNVGPSWQALELPSYLDLLHDGVGPVQREIRQLLDAGLVTRKIVGAQTLYSANQESPVFAEIKSLVTKTVGIHDVLRTVLDPLRKKINLAFVYGFVARSGET